jgi:3'5'-cyclic nucleotide phosphodiesterase
LVSLEQSLPNDHLLQSEQSVQKLLARIITPSDVDRAYEINASAGADHTYGITSDPLTQFSCVFSAVIHDVDHPGVPNVALVNEKTNLAAKYKNKSIAEQNSVDLAWKLLMHDRYGKLRSAIYTNDAEMCRFRQLVVNSVMATDIADKDQKTFRNARWDKAFHQNLQEDQQVAIYRKATIVIEHLIQASDVSHTMQHVRKALCCILAAFKHSI